MTRQKHHLPRILKRLGRGATIAGALACAALAHAQSGFPNKPIRIIVPIAAGSVTDVALRAATPALTEKIGQAVIIDNRPGASGIVGAEACAKAAPDGYTICAVYHAITSYNPFMFDKLSYDPAKDFAPIGRLFFVTEGLVVPSSLPVSTVAELKSYALKNPSGVNLGTLGEGSLQDLMVVWLNREWGTKIVGVPYKGGGPIATAITAGEIQMAQMGLGNFVGLIQAGQIRAISVAAATRSRQLPTVQTAEEAGLGGFPARPWWGIVAPANTPPAVIARLNADFNSVFRDPKMLEFMETNYLEPATTTPAEFGAFMRADRESAGKLVSMAKAPQAK